MQLVRPNSNTQIPTRPPSATQTAVVCAIPGKPNHYFVESEDKKTAFRVYWDGTCGQCTCPDFNRGANQRPGYHCIHINAVKNHQREDGNKSGEELVKILAKPFRDDQICEHDGMKTIKLSEVVKRLNEAFGPMNWSFSYEEPVDCGNEFVCNGRLEVSLGDEKTWKENAGHCQFVEDERIEVGDPDYNNPECGFAVGMGEARVGAVHATLKSCAMFFGIGLEQLSEPPTNLVRDRGTERQPGNFIQPFVRDTPF